LHLNSACLKRYKQEKKQHYEKGQKLSDAEITKYIMKKKL
jgi:hypothetical protein